MYFAKIAFSQRFQFPCIKCNVSTHPIRYNKLYETGRIFSFVTLWMLSMSALWQYLKEKNCLFPFFKLNIHRTTTITRLNTPSNEINYLLHQFKLMRLRKFSWLLPVSSPGRHVVLSNLIIDGEHFCCYLMIEFCHNDILNKKSKIRSPCFSFKVLKISLLWF